MPFSLGIHGAGPTVRPYVEALALRHDVRVLAVADADAAAAHGVAEAWGARGFAHLEAMLDTETPDALLCFAPVADQPSAVLAAAQRKIPVLVEAPGAPSAEAAAPVQHQLAAEGVLAGVSYVYRRIDIVREAREYLGTQAVPLTLGWWLAKPAAAAVSTWESVELLTMLDLIVFFTGPVAQVTAAASGGEAWIATLQMASGGIATLGFGFYDLLEPRIELELIGAGWSFRFQDDLATLRLAERTKTTILRQRNEPHAEVLGGFLEAVRTGDARYLACSYAEAAATLAVRDAILTAAREQRWVTIAAQ